MNCTEIAESLNQIDHHITAVLWLLVSFVALYAIQHR